MNIEVGKFVATDSRAGVPFISGKVMDVFKKNGVDWVSIAIGSPKSMLGHLYVAPHDTFREIPLHDPLDPIHSRPFQPVRDAGPPVDEGTESGIVRAVAVRSGKGGGSAEESGGGTFVWQLQDGAELPHPACRYGYTNDQLRDILGPVAIVYFLKWMSGQTAAICVETNGDYECDAPHGHATYRHDLKKYLGL